METDKPQDVQAASWRANIIAPVQRPAGLGPRKSQCSFQFESKGGKMLMSAWKQPGRENCLLLEGLSVFLFCSDLQQIEWGPPTLGRAICFTQSINLNVKLTQRHSHRNMQNNIWPNIWAPCGPVKLTHKRNPHKWLSPKQRWPRFRSQIQASSPLPRVFLLHYAVFWFICNKWILQKKTWKLIN